MEHVLPVHVDIIIDPFVFNILPRSLVPTVAYILTLATGSWYLSKYISNWFQTVAEPDITSEKKNT
jgi:hypothetical protein